MIEASDQHRDAVAALCQSTGARRLAAFGSAVRDDFDPERSDLDFLVAFDDLPPARYANAYFALKTGLETLFGRPVDLITDGSVANPYFRTQVTAEARTLYARWGGQASLGRPPGGRPHRPLACLIKSDAPWVSPESAGSR